MTNSASVTANTLDSNLSNNGSSRTVSVVAAPIIVSSPIAVSGTKQNNITTATFTHAKGVHPASYYTATIDWGDGNFFRGQHHTVRHDLYGERLPYVYQKRFSHGYNDRDPSQRCIAADGQ